MTVSCHDVQTGCQLSRCSLFGFISNQILNHMVQGVVLNPGSLCDFQEDETEENRSGCQHYANAATSSLCLISGQNVLEFILQPG